MRYICKKLIMSKANNHSDKRVGKSKPSKLKAPETSYSKKRATPSKPKSKASSNTVEIRLNKYIAKLLNINLLTNFPAKHIFNFGTGMH